MSGNKNRESNIIDKSQKSSGADKSGNGRKIVSKGTASSNDTTSSKDRGARKQRASDLGRALRSIYDDTLRESVPDDFQDLLGKLS